MYLYVFVNYKIWMLECDKKENDFFFFLYFLKIGNGVILDIGVNFGIMMVYFVKNFFESFVYSFEFMLQNVVVFYCIIWKNWLNNVKVYEVVLGDQVGMVKMILFLNWNMVMQGFSYVKYDFIMEWNEGMEFEVLLMMFDFFEFLIVQGIKIDVENFEYFVLKGGIKLLECDKLVIYVELWDN